ncbi:MATE family efflux transporter [Virgibacillus sp. W0181]|uniref:MATE family efflux transporter n=1 Tax=Virgibacillus sp. W0181 TaxID=3391581 RepID=UPI003F453D27
MSIVNERLGTQSVVKSFFQYFIPTILGMMLMSVNIVIDGIFVGNGVGALALAGVNIAVPVFSIIISVALLIGIGGGALYSMAMGENNTDHAKKIFSTSMVLVTVITIFTSLISYLNIKTVARLFGATEETLPYVIDYMTILLLFSLVLAIEVSLSIFVRNDGDPQLATLGLVITAILNIILNYWMIFILQLGVTGAAFATVIATAAGVLIYMLHFLKKGSGLKFVKIGWNKRDILSISKIGFPSFLSEAGMGVFVMGYNIAMAYHIGTSGLAAFSVINYLHVFMFLAFIGIGSTIQPMISYYYGAKKFTAIKTTVQIAEVTGLALGLLFIGIGYFGADYLVSIFGITSSHIASLATNGLKLFFLGYIFMGINFIYMTYYQSIGQIKPSIGITVFRGFILLAIMLLVLPIIFGINGIWLALPVAEGIVAIVLLAFARKGIMDNDLALRDFST